MAALYPNVRTRPSSGGRDLFWVLDRNVETRGIEVRLNTPARELIRRAYQLGDVRSNDVEYGYDWSEDNSRELEIGVLKQADTISGLAALIGVDETVLVDTVQRWNELCARGEDADFGRPPGSMAPIRTPPFVFGQVWPTVSNTQGGPVHDAAQKIIDTAGQPIPRLFAAGELGSSFGHLYLSGANITECFVTGRLAGQGAAALPPWN